MCTSFDEGWLLHAEHGGKGRLAQPCWQFHPGVCATLDAPILEPCLSCGNSLVGYVCRIGAASQPYLMFVRQLGEVRTHLLVFMVGSTLIASGPRVVFFAEKIAEIELRVLVGYTLEQLGYDCGDCLRS